MLTSDMPVQQIGSCNSHVLFYASQLAVSCETAYIVSAQLKLSDLLDF